MGMTMTQKILAAHAGLESVKAGQLIEADLDLVLGNDITSPVAIAEMEKMNTQTVFDKDKIALVMDHFIPNTVPVRCITGVIRIGNCQKSYGGSERSKR